MDDAGTSDTLVGGTESTSDSTVTATSSGEGTTDLAGTRSIKILELEDRGEQPYVVRLTMRRISEGRRLILVFIVQNMGR